MLSKDSNTNQSNNTMQNRHVKPIRKSQKPCAEFGCGNLTRNTYCKTHQKNAQESTRKYDKEIRDPITNAFYRSVEWVKVRLLALERDNHLCQWCLKDGELNKADVVHHIIEVKDNWSLRLVLSNLVSLCHKCHNRHHKGSPRGQKF